MANIIVIALLLITVVTYVAGDVLTTWYCITTGIGEEANPLARMVMDKLGIDMGMIVLAMVKIVLVAMLAVLLFELSDTGKPHLVVFSIGAAAFNAIVGVVIVVNNMWTLTGWKL